MADLVHPRYPIILFHGFGAFSHLAAGGSFGPIVRTLREKGYRILAPMVPPYAPISIRAQVWKAHLDQFQLQLGYSQFNAIAHSMGGLDARHLIANLGGHQYIRTLTTLSTPHRGSSLASYLLKHPAVLRRLITGIMNRAGNRLYADTRAQAEAALRELTPDFVQTQFNPHTPDHPDVVYRSFAGHAGKNTAVPLSPSLYFINRILHFYEGVNDGFVSIDSSKWTGFEGLIEVDHARLFGIRWESGSMDVPGFYETLIRDLAQQGY